MNRRRAAAIGATGGFASGLLGVGGGTVMVPLMTIGRRVNQKRAQAISLAAIIPISLVALTVYVVAGEVRYLAALVLIIGAAAGAPVGATIAARLPDRLLRRIFGVLLFASGVTLIVRAFL